MFHCTLDFFILSKPDFIHSEFCFPAVNQNLLTPLHLYFQHQHYQVVLFEVFISHYHLRVHGPICSHGGVLQISTEVQMHDSQALFQKIIHRFTSLASQVIKMEYLKPVNAEACICSYAGFVKTGTKFGRAITLILFLPLWDLA